MKISRVEIFCREKEWEYTSGKFESAGDVAEYVDKHFNLRNADREHFITISVDAKGQPICIEETAIGGRTSAKVDPPLVFKTAILNNAWGIIVVHNHPSGSVLPSDADKEMAKRLSDGGKILGIKLMDSIIIGDGVHSMLSHGEIL